MTRQQQPTRFRLLPAILALSACVGLFWPAPAPAEPAATSFTMDGIARHGERGRGRFGRRGCGPKQPPACAPDEGGRKKSEPRGLLLACAGPAWRKAPARRGRARVGRAGVRAKTAPRMRSVRGWTEEVGTARVAAGVSWPCLSKAPSRAGGVRAVAG